MAEINLLYEAVRLLMTLGAAALGSIVIWKLLGPRIVKKWGSDRIFAWMKSLGDDGQEESEENKLLHRAVQTQVGHLFMDILTDLETPEGRQKYAPFVKHLYSVVQASVFGTWGQIVKGMQEEGNEITGGNPLAAFNNMPSSVAAIAGKVFPGVDIKDMVGVMQWLGSQSGKGGNGDVGGFASPNDSGGAPAGHRGSSSRGVTQ